ncbi:MAG: alpha-L-fucosidase [Lachnospiraceae bacterium]|nr:alpha-L-fucosidase [Lachnospiraceae bacterium]MDD3614746.1 alpha-L-fucosidase [Lachnospiraceae bacterium]
MNDTKQQWFKDAKYGLFIHWGLYALLAGEYKGQKTDRIAEWIMNYLNIPVEEYRKLAADFNPVDFNADEIVRKAKEDWGMKYLVFTSKHHEGFAMYNSPCNDYNVVKATPYGKDILKQFRDACTKYDMKFGFYYSQAQDWDDPDGFMHTRDNSGKNFQRYLDEKCKPQLRELLTNYGEISLIWFDTPMGISIEQTQELIDLVKGIQPNCILNGRTGNHMGDYMTTGDNFIPRLPYEGDWEVPATVNDTWGFNKFDNNWKNPDDIIRMLLKISSRGGNYLLNIGPDALGNVPQGCVDVLDEVGRYVNDNSEAIFGTKRVGLYPYELEWAQFTQKDYKLYVHILQPRLRVELLNVANNVKEVYLVKDHSPLPYMVGKVCEGDSVIEVELPKELHEKKNYAICVEMEEKEPIFEDLKG